MSVVQSAYADFEFMACQTVGTLLWGVVQIKVMMICSIAAYNDTGRARWNGHDGPPANNNIPPPAIVKAASFTAHV